MNYKKLNIFVFSLTLLLITNTASAHLHPFDFITNPGGKATITTSGGTTQYAVTNEFAPTNYTWHQATDAGADSHGGAWFSFDIGAGGAYVGFNVTGSNAFLSGSPVTGQYFNPAFTLYSGLFPDSVHDGATYDVFNPTSGPINVYKEGEWQSLADTTMGNSAGDIGTISYITHAGENNTTNNTFIENFFLDQGSYTLGVGGACVLCANPLPMPTTYEEDTAAIRALSGNVSAEDFWWLNGQRADDDFLYLFDATLSVQPVPVPAAVWLFATALFGLIGARRKSYKS